MADDAFDPQTWHPIYHSSCGGVVMYSRHLVPLGGRVPGPDDRRGVDGSPIPFAARLPICPGCGRQVESTGQMTGRKPDAQ